MCKLYYLIKLNFCNEFSSPDSGIMIKSVFSLVLIELSDLLVLNGICLYFHVIVMR